MNSTAYHFHPELLGLLIDTIPLLVKGKRDVVMFFRSAGVPNELTDDLSKQLKDAPQSIGKYDIARTVLGRINDRDAEMLSQRREVVKRVCEFENFSTCWPSDQLKAKGLVADVRQHVNVKDAFSRMNQEREAEHRSATKAATEKRDQEVAEIEKKRAAVQKVKTDLFALFGEKNPQARGKALEGVLNQLFAAFGVLIREDFQIRSESGRIIYEQIDGAIEFDGHVYLVEMKWHSEPIGVPDVSTHLVRIFSRGNSRGLFISVSGYTESAVNTCKESLRQATIALIELSEVVRLLEAERDLRDLLKAKIHAALLDKSPLHRVEG